MKLIMVISAVLCYYVTKHSAITGVMGLDKKADLKAKLLVYMHLVILTRRKILKSTGAFN